MTGQEDREIVEGCRRGEEKAWQALTGRFGPRVYSIAYHFTLRREDAEELSQEIFLKVFENLHRYDGSYSLAAWIVSLARNLCIDHYRRHKREKSFPHVSDEAILPLLSASDDPGETAIRKERAAMLFEAIRQLPEELAEILILRDLDGLSYEEIGGALQLPDGTVKSRLFRARAEAARAIRARLERKTGLASWAPLALAAVAGVAR